MPPTSKPVCLSCKPGEFQGEGECLCDEVEDNPYRLPAVGGPTPPVGGLGTTQAEPSMDSGRGTGSLPGCPVPGGSCLNCDDDHCREL